MPFDGPPPPPGRRRGGRGRRYVTVVTIMVIMKTGLALSMGFITVVMKNQGRG
jgi:hypothetical protein